jgi:hypothetical protein
MPRLEKDRLAAEFEKRWIDFQMGLSDNRKYPSSSFASHGKLDGDMRT